jgi:precorrin-4/cobalt-precorrin-4 C11-methyltransferase
MVHFVGAGPGAADLITVRGQELIRAADIIIYAGSLVNAELLEIKKAGCKVYNSAVMTLEEVMDVILLGEADGKTTVRLHTGDPSLYGAIREQMDLLEKRNIAFDVCPGVSSFCGAAAVLNLEYTLPEVSQSVIITRMSGKTSVPEKEDIAAFAAHNSTMVIFLSTGMLKQLSEKLLEGGYKKNTPAAIVYKATWKEEKKFICTVDTLEQTAKDNNISKTALIIVGEVIAHSDYRRSQLYNPAFSTEYRPVGI